MSFFSSTNLGAVLETLEEQIPWSDDDVEYNNDDGGGSDGDQEDPLQYQQLNLESLQATGWKVPDTDGECSRTEKATTCQVTAGRRDGVEKDDEMDNGSAVPRPTAGKWRHPQVVTP